MAHVSQESRFQTIQFFRFIAGNNQFLFSFFQRRDVIIDTQHLNNAVLRTIISDHYVNAGPCIFAILPAYTNFFTQTGCLSRFHFTYKVFQNSLIFRNHMCIYSDNLWHGNTFFLSQIPVPCILGISVSCQYIEMSKSYLGIITDEKKQILKFLYLGVCIGRFRRIYIDKQIVDKSILRIIESSNFSVKINNPISPAIYILIYFGEVIIDGEIYIFFRSQSLFNL